MDWSLLGFRGLNQVLNIHPVFVHFPIALFPTTLLFYAIGILRKKDRFLLGGHVLLLLAFTSVGVAVITGLVAFNNYNLPHGDKLHSLMLTHQMIGYIVLSFGSVLALWSFVRQEGLPRFPKLFLLVLFLTSVMVLQNGDLGGRMVFVEGAAVKAAASKPKPEQSNHHHEDDDQEPHHHKEK